MKTILVDDDFIGMQGFEIECDAIPEIVIVGKFISPLKALEYARNNTVDFALLDIEMPGMNGLELYEELKKISPEMIIVFVTAHTSYAVQVIKRKADYIIFKPYDKDEINDVIHRVQLLKKRLKKMVYCQTFGRFDVFIDGDPVVFKSAKAKEILAICVYRRGAPVTAEEIIDKLWEDYNGTVGECSVFRFTVKKLMDTLKEYNAVEVFGRKKGICFVNNDILDCDYYHFLRGSMEAKKKFRGEFMSEYSWAEPAIYDLQVRAEE